MSSERSAPIAREKKLLDHLCLQAEHDGKSPNFYRPPKLTGS